MKIGDKVKITEMAKSHLPYDVDTEFIIVDILEKSVQYPIVLKSKEFGEDWIQFFKENEIITEYGKK